MQTVFELNAIRLIKKLCYRNIEYLWSTKTHQFWKLTMIWILRDILRISENVLLSLYSIDSLQIHLSITFRLKNYNIEKISNVLSNRISIVQFVYQEYSCSIFRFINLVLLKKRDIFGSVYFMNLVWHSWESRKISAVTWIVYLTELVYWYEYFVKYSMTA